MNKGKEGRKFVYPDSFIKLLGYMRAYFHLPYRQTEGIVWPHAANTLPSIPDYSRICRRINILNIKINDDANNSRFHDDNFVIAIDSTDVKVTNRGEWIRRKWKVKRGYLKNTYSSWHKKEENSIVTGNQWKSTWWKSITWISWWYNYKT